MLCALCISIILKGVENGLHHKDLADLSKAAQSGCKVCRQLLKDVEEAERQNADSSDAPSGSPYLTFTLRSISLSFQYRRKPMGAVYLEWEDCCSDLSPSTGFHDAMALAETDIEHEPWRVRVDGLPEAIPSNTGDPSLTRLMSMWLDSCLKDHKGKCGASPDVDASWHPKRLLRISESSDRVRLIDTAFEKPTGRYATLSHCWGPNPTFLRLDASNMASLMADGIATAALPPSFRDTVVTCQRLHIAYLWIDSLCIQQHGAGSDADWSLHAIQMAPIYQNCVLNIAIDRAASPWDGAFVSRDPSPLQHSTVRLLHRTCTVGSAADEHEKLRGRQPLAARAWVLQERLLAPRVLHFGGDRVFWECSVAWLDELRPGPGGCRGAPPSRPLAVYDPFDVPTDARGKPARFWNVIVKRYSALQLSHPREDKLVAIAAVARRVAPLFGGKGEYVAGHFRRTLPGELLWRPEVGMGGGRRQWEWRAPSWSWASMDGACSVSARRRVDAEIVEVVGVEVELVDPEDEYGRVRSGVLRLRGLLLGFVTAGVESEEHPGWVEGVGSAGTSVAGGSLRALVSFDDVERQQWYLSEELFVMPFNDEDGLVFRRMEEHVYERVGRCWGCGEDFRAAEKFEGVQKHVVKIV